MATTVKNGQLVTAANTNETEIEFASTNAFTYPTQKATITVVTGAFQFSVGEAIVAGHHSWAADDTLSLTFQNGGKNIRYKAGTGGDTFVITI